MLNKPIEEIIVEDGKVVGVKSDGEVRPNLNLNLYIILQKILFVSLKMEFKPKL